MPRWPALVLSILVPVFLPRPAQAFDVFDCVDPRPPVAKLAEYEFTEGQALHVVSGVWTTSGGTFNSTSTATAIATIDFCTPPSVVSPPPVTDVPTAQLDSPLKTGIVGVISHWAPGRCDDLRMEEPR